MLDEAIRQPGAAHYSACRAGRLVCRFQHGRRRSRLPACPSFTVTTSGSSSTALKSVVRIERLGEAGGDDADVQPLLPATVAPAFTHVKQTASRTLTKTPSSPSHSCTSAWPSSNRRHASGIRPSQVRLGIAQGRGTVVRPSCETSASAPRRVRRLACHHHEVREESRVYGDVEDAVVRRAVRPRQSVARSSVNVTSQILQRDHPGKV